MDSNYILVKTVVTGWSLPPVDMHEFKVINNGASALVTSYGQIPYGHFSVNVAGGIGWLLNGWFQEVDVTTGTVIFQWSAIDNVQVSNSMITPGSTDVSGTGLYPQSPFDYFHINAIDKTTSGNYLVSGRHVSTIYYISAIDGSIIWRVSSQKQSDFNVTGSTFGFQHDVRFVSQNDTYGHFNLR